MSLNKFVKIIGADETGVGDYFTPLVACAAYIPEQNYHFIAQMNLKDSKLLTDEKVLLFAEQIKKYVYFNTSFLSQEVYNELTLKYNANELKMLLHLKNINSLEQKHAVDVVIIDQFSTEKSIQQYQKRLTSDNLKLEKIKNKLILETKAESKYLAVTVAAILGREFLIKKMAEQNSTWSTIFPLGASNLVDEFGREFVKIHGQESLKKVAKVSFKNTQRIIS